MSSKEKKKGVVPRLRFPEFQDAGPWEVKRLGEISNRIIEKVGTKKIVTVSITAGKGFVTQTEKFGRDISGKQYKNYILLKKGQFSYNRGNSKTFPQGAIYQLCEFEEAAVPNAFYSFEFKEDYVSEFFIGYFESNFHGRQLIKFITSSARGDGLLNISADDFFSIILPTPTDKKEQQKIADCLSSLDELIELQTKKLEALKAHKKGLMQKLFPREGETIPRLRFPEFRDAGPWEVKRLGEVGEIITGTTPSTKKTEYYENGIYPWVTPTDIGEGKNITETKTRLSKEGLAAGKFVPRNSLLVTCIASIGKNAILRVDGSCNQQINAITSLKSTNVDFLYYLIESKVHILVNAAGQGGMAILNKNDFSNLRFAFPSIEEQQKIADCLSSLDELIELQTKKLELLKQHKKGLMQGLFPSDEDLNSTKIKQEVQND